MSHSVGLSGFLCHKRWTHKNSLQESSKFDNLSNVHRFIGNKENYHKEHGHLSVYGSHFSNLLDSSRFEDFPIWWYTRQNQHMINVVKYHPTIIDRDRIELALILKMYGANGWVIGHFTSWLSWVCDDVNDHFLWHKEIDYVHVD